jgi:hypothetical protein
MQNVNGYLCRDCSDVARAKKGIDPALSSSAPRAHAREPERIGPARPGDAVGLASGGDVGTKLHVVA